MAAVSTTNHAGTNVECKMNLNFLAIPKTQRGLMITGYGYPSLSNSSLNLVYNWVMEWWTLELKHTGGVDKTPKYGRTLHGYELGISWHFKIFLVRSIKSSKLANSGMINSNQHWKKKSSVDIFYITEYKPTITNAQSTKNEFIFSTKSVHSQRPKLLHQSDYFDIYILGWVGGGL